MSLRLNLGRAILTASCTDATRQVTTGRHGGRPDAPSQRQVFTRSLASRERPDAPIETAPPRQVTYREHLEPQIHDRTRQMLCDRMLTRVRSFDCSSSEKFQHSSALASPFISRDQTLPRRVRSQSDPASDHMPKPRHSLQS
jgi:hypothetical protein